MKRAVKILLEFVVVSLELMGCLTICYGLKLIWEPIAWIFSGVVILYLGISVYRSLRE